MSHEAFTDVVVVVEVLDALMNHLEDTLEAVLSRGENLTLDNKVGKLTSTTKTSHKTCSCGSFGSPEIFLFVFVPLFSFLFFSGLSVFSSVFSSGSSAVFPTHSFMCGSPPQYQHLPPHIDLFFLICVSFSLTEVSSRQ